MLLVIDVGNTNIVVGAMDGERVVQSWRVSSVVRTTDEFGLLLLQRRKRAESPTSRKGIPVSACAVSHSPCHTKDWRI